MHITALRNRKLTRTTYLALGLLFASLSGIAGAQAPPDSPLSRLVGKLAQKRSTEASRPITKADLLRPEFRFRPAAGWLFLPELAERLSTNAEEQAAVLQLMEIGAAETRRLLAAEGAENDIAAATALFVSQLWQFVRSSELPEADTDALHAQIAGVLAGPELAAMSDADKQRYWEFCVGFPVFVLGLREVIEDDSALADLRSIAGAGFESLIGVQPETVDIGPEGLTVRAGLEGEVGSGIPTGSPATADGAWALDYTPPPGWSREDAGWATTYRATLLDLDHQGRPDPNSERRHAAAIFVLPPRPAPQGAGPLFEALWREQFVHFDLGDTVVHYRSRLLSGMVVYYMGRFFARTDQPDARAKTYGVLYLVELAGVLQPVIATLEPGHSMFSMSSMNEFSGFQALSAPLGALLDSIVPRGGPAPRPSGGLFQRSEMVGNWKESSSAFGGFYVNTATGASAGAAVTASGGSFHVRDDGSYDYNFAYYSHNPAMGSSSGSTKHHGRYRLDGDIFIAEPTTNIGYNFRYCTVGVGTRQTAHGLRRILVMVGADAQGTFRAPSLIPDWDSYAGTMNWYQEE